MDRGERGWRQRGVGRGERDRERREGGMNREERGVERGERGDRGDRFHDTSSRSCSLPSSTGMHVCPQIVVPGVMMQFS